MPYYDGFYNRNGECVGDFHSCMDYDNDGEEHYLFYENAVDAKAACLRNGEGEIIARCVIFTKVEDETGKVWRLAERQYATDGNELYKRLLVQKLIKCGYIDGYKTVGAGCHDAQSFVDNEGHSLNDKCFSIRCDLDYGDILSYQDSFKWYSYDDNTAYNTSSGGYDYDLSSTDLYFERGDEYDSYHGGYVENVVTVYVHGHEETCDEDDLDDFTYVEREGYYYHNDDVVFCRDTDQYEVETECVYSDILEEWYYDADEMEDDENEWKEENGWTYSEYNSDWYEDAADVTTWKVGPGLNDETISVASLQGLMAAGRAIFVDGVHYCTRDFVEYQRALHTSFAAV